jgi:hypothetical protein
LIFYLKLGHFFNSKQCSLTHIDDCLHIITVHFISIVLPQYQLFAITCITSLQPPTANTQGDSLRTASLVLVSYTRKSYFENKISKFILILCVTSNAFILINCLDRVFQTICKAYCCSVNKHSGKGSC